MSADPIALRRLHQQRLAGNPAGSPSEVVAWLGAVQAQDYAGAKWALGLRLQAATDRTIDEALAAGSILRTHVMRPTWHFVPPADIRWMQELTAPRVNAASASMYRRHGLDDAFFSRTNAVIAAALAGGRYLTRAELGSALAEAGIPAEGNRLAYIVMRAELDAVICSGPRRGKQFTYALLDERAPHARSLPPDEALAELTRRYFTGHGPAVARDFAWWSGLTVAAARKGIEMAGPALAHETIDGVEYWFSDHAPPASEPPPAALLLPVYDELHIGYVAFGASRAEGGAEGETRFDATIVARGRIAGTWKRRFERGGVVVDLAPIGPEAAEGRALRDAAERYARFLEMPLMLS